MCVVFTKNKHFCGINCQLLITLPQVEKDLSRSFFYREDPNFFGKPPSPYIEHVYDRVVMEEYTHYENAYHIFE